MKRPSIVTDRLTLRPHALDDAEAVYALPRDEAVLRFIRSLPVTREEAMGAMLGWFDRERPETRCVCIIDPENTSSIRLAAKLGFERYGLANYREAKVGKYERHRHDRGRDPRS